MPEGELCVASFSDGGALEGPPVCNGPYPRDEGPYYGCAYIAAAVRELGIVAGDGSGRLFFVPTDTRGTATGLPSLVTEWRGHVGQYGIAWAETGFAVLFAMHAEPLHVQMFAPMP